MNVAAPEPKTRSPARLLIIRGVILAFAAWAIFMGWQMAQLPPNQPKPLATATAP